MRESTCNWRERDLEIEEEPSHEDSGIGTYCREKLEGKTSSWMQAKNVAVLK